MQIFMDPRCAAVDGNISPHAPNEYGYFVYKKDGSAVVRRKLSYPFFTSYKISFNILKERKKSVFSAKLYFQPFSCVFNFNGENTSCVCILKKCKQVLRQNLTSTPHFKVP